MKTRVSAAAQVDYRDYQLSRSTRKGENIEWSTAYIYNRCDDRSPRALVIGDSICNNYQKFLREKLSSRGTLTFWASSYCVTDPAYLPMLDLVLSGPAPQVILFNNGLHSFTSDENEWLDAYIRAAEFIRAKHHHAKLFLVTCTPLRSDPDGKVAAVNERTLAAAEILQLPVIDLFAFTDKLDRRLWSDLYHIGGKGREMQAAFLAGIIDRELPAATRKVEQKGTATGPSGRLK